MMEPHQTSSACKVLKLERNEATVSSVWSVNTPWCHDVKYHSEASSLVLSCRHLGFLGPEVTVLDQRAEPGRIMLIGSDWCHSGRKSRTKQNQGADSRKRRRVQSASVELRWSRWSADHCSSHTTLLERFICRAGSCSSNKKHPDWNMTDSRCFNFPPLLERRLSRTLHHVSWRWCCSPPARSALLTNGATKSRLGEFDTWSDFAGGSYIN